MNSLFMGALIGLALGVRHSLEPDHLAAVGTFVSQTRHPRRAAVLGALWGAGHSVGLISLGAVVLALRGETPGWLDSALELLVGCMLVFLGVRAVRAGRSTDQSSHDEAHARVGFGPFTVGLGHGVAGTGAAVLLATSTMPDTAQGLLFLGLFGAGSVVGMALVAGLLSIPMGRAATTNRRRKWLLGSAGALSLLVGLWWIVRSFMGLTAALG